jgi:hypothetical protein
MNEQVARRRRSKSGRKREVLRLVAIALLIVFAEVLMRSAWPHWRPCPDDNTPRLLSHVVASLMRQLEPKGEYALAVNRGMGTAEIHCAFGLQADADLFAASVQAVASESYSGWLSQRAFTLDVAAAQRIERTRDDFLRAKGMRPRRR